MGLIMLQEAFMFLMGIYAIIAAVVCVIAAILLIIAIIFFLVAKKVRAGKIKTALNIASAVFAAPAVFVVQFFAGGAVVLALDENLPFTAVVFAIMLVLFIAGLTVRRVRFFFKLLLCVPWFALSPCIIYSLLMPVLPEDLYGFGTLFAISAIVTIGSAFLLYRSYRGYRKEAM